MTGRPQILVFLLTTCLLNSASGSASSPVWSSASSPEIAAANGDQAGELQEASRLIREGHLADAERRLREILSQGRRPEALDLLGVVLARTNRVQEAEEVLQASLGMAADRIAPHQNLALLYLRTGADDRALHHLRRAAELGKLDRNLASHLARAELAAGRADAAEIQLRELAETHGSVNAMLQLARIQVQRGDHEGALATLREALGVAPNAEDLLALYARTSLASRNPAWSIRPLQALVRMVPEDPDYPYLLGVARMQVGQLEEAAAVLSAAVDQRPDHLLSFVALGLTLNRSKQYARAIKVLERAELLAPQNVEVLSALAEAYVGSNLDQRAEQTAARALGLDPHNAVAKWSLGMVRMRQGRFAEARDAFEASAEREPGSAKTHYQLSLALARLGEHERSQHHLELYRKAQRDAERNLLELQGVPTEPPLEATSSDDPP